MASAAAHAGDSMRLSVPARPQSVGPVRHRLTELGRSLGFEREALADLQTAVTEACMNAATHAYDGGDGEIEVAAEPVDGGLQLTVRDHGHGIRPRPAIGAATGRLGLLLIAALAARVEIRSQPQGGTELRIVMSREPTLA